jgi:putative transposase
VLGEVGLEDTVAGRRRYAERMRERAVDELEDNLARENETLRRGWCLGGASFREKVLGLIEKAGEKLSKAKEVDASIKRSHGEEEACRLLQRGLEHLGLEETELRAMKRNDERKLALARLIRTRTSVSTQWIARELSLGHVSSITRYCSKNNGRTELEVELAASIERQSS